MITSAQQKAIESSIIGKPVYDTELCFYVKNKDSKTQALIEQLVIRLTELYGYALFETVSQLIPNKEGFKSEDISRIRVLMSNKVWDQNFVSLTWVVYAVLHLFGMSQLDIAIDGILYRAQK